MQELRPIRAPNFPRARLTSSEPDLGLYGVSPAHHWDEARETAGRCRG